jgi:hypothetical protein
LYNVVSFPAEVISKNVPKPKDPPS